MMKKNYLKAICLTVAIACMPASAYACVEAIANNVEECNTVSVESRADIKYYVHKEMNGVTMHRLWNSTKGVYEGPWMVCDCK